MYYYLLPGPPAFQSPKTRQSRARDRGKIEALSLWCLLIAHARKLILKENEFPPCGSQKNCENKGVCDYQ